MIKDPYSIKYHLEKAYNLALSGRPGPVWIDIPADIQNFKIQERKLKGFNNNYIIKKSKKIDTQINKVAELLSKSNRPIIHIGHGVKLSKAENVFLKLINRFKIPFMQTWNADDVVIHDHKMNMGKPGAFGSRYSNFIIQSSDFYLSIGTRLPFMVTGYDAKDYARKAKVKVMIDIDKNELKKNGMSINYKICCDAKYFIEKLNFFLKKINKINKWIKYCNYLKK